MTPRSAPFRRFLAPLVLLALLVPPSGATWSIVAVNRRTGEVAVASATCLGNFNLKLFVPAIVVGKGAAAAQSSVDIAARNRRIIYRELQLGTPPEDILTLLAGQSGHQSKQYGIVAMNGSPVTFTGNGAGKAKGGVAGFEGDLYYAIQGNVLAGEQVFLAAESALLDTPGDLGQRIMAGMEAARALGGDGRCSCSQTKPTSCGTPPPGFQKSAHVGFVLLARMGDVDGGCASLTGCAAGSYYLDLNVIGGANDPDPVLQLAELYGDWRRERRERPDHLWSSATTDFPSIPADGVTKTRVLVRLADINGVPLRRGGARLSVSPLDAQAAAMGIGPIDDNEDGTYLFEITASTTPGEGSFEIRADDGVVTATLFPYLRVQLDPPLGLHVGLPSVGPGGAGVPFVVHLPDVPGAPFALVAWLAPAGASAAGKAASLAASAGLARWIGPGGWLDAAGRAEGTLALPPSLLAGGSGAELWLQAVHAGGACAPVRVPGGL